MLLVTTNAISSHACVAAGTVVGASVARFNAEWAQQPTYWPPIDVRTFCMHAHLEQKERYAMYENSRFHTLDIIYYAKRMLF